MTKQRAILTKVSHPAPGGATFRTTGSVLSAARPRATSTWSSCNPIVSKRVLSPRGLRWLRSNWPEQFLQFEEVGGLLLPALDADVADGIAGAMQQHQRHQPALHREIDIRLRVSESREQTLQAARHSGEHERAQDETI